MSTDGAGHGGHSGFGSDVGHSAGLDNADLGVGHGHHGHHSGGHRGLDHNGRVTTEALMVAYSHSATPGFANFGHVNAAVDTHGMPDHGQLGGWSTGDGVDKKSLGKRQDEFLRKLKEAQNDPMRRVYGVHVVSHGWCNVPAIFTDLATRYGAIRVCGTTGNFYPTDVSLNELADWSKVAAPYSRKRPPAGWYPKAIGVTHVWRQYWQVLPKEPILATVFSPRKGRRIYDRSQGTYMEVQVVTWFYADIGDYETRVDINVVSLPVLDQQDKTWGFKGKSLKIHQNVAEKITEGLFDALRYSKPSVWAKTRRNKLITLQTTRPAEVEQSGADLDSLFNSNFDGKTGALKELAAAVNFKTVPADVVIPATADSSSSSQATKNTTTPAPAPTGKEVTVYVKIPPVVQR